MIVFLMKPNIINGMAIDWTKVSEIVFQALLTALIGAGLVYLAFRLVVKYRGVFLFFQFYRVKSNQEFPSWCYNLVRVFFKAGQSRVDSINLLIKGE